MTVGRVHAKGPTGSGFSIATATGRSSRVMLTAAHVVRDRDPSSIVFVHPDGRGFPVERVESDEDIDVAVPHLRAELDGFVAARVRDRLAWQVDARPRDNDPRLTGEVIDSRRLFSKSGGRDVRVVQLRAHEAIGDYQGYSGSPVMLGLTESPPVLGVLIEQLR
ncbi:serine protease [Actinoplanes sp. NBRC 103695]|uniref:S1 family peptidase n=1 Tax=Actinoplanes sp. NBRC 103695 TaxID=3032202 RepID=UPI0024A3D3BD|nr:serine protease [Actinoplanes sp. NBRC 103695]GLY92850.1 hypothetical protein Acsp02_01060 [Actinoplanes sp. NBRC 103695]